MCRRRPGLRRQPTGQAALAIGLVSSGVPLAKVRCLVLRSGRDAPTQAKFAARAQGPTPSPILSIRAIGSGARVWNIGP